MGTCCSVFDATANDALTTPLKAFLPVRTTSPEECTRASRGHAFEIKHRMNVLLLGRAQPHVKRRTKYGVESLGCRGLTVDSPVFADTVSNRDTLSKENARHGVPFHRLILADVYLSHRSGRPPVNRTRETDSEFDR